MARRVGSAVVPGPDGNPGIITERDLLHAIADGSDPGTTPVSGYMTSDAVAVTASWEVVDAARTMVERGFRHLIVKDHRGEVTGIVSIRDMRGARGGAPAGARRMSHRTNREERGRHT